MSQSTEQPGDVVLVHARQLASGPCPHCGHDYTVDGKGVEGCVEDELATGKTVAVHRAWLAGWSSTDTAEVKA